MRKIIILLLVLLTQFIQAQEGFNYQAVLRDANGEILSSEPVTLQISIKEVSQYGFLAYREIHDITTDNFGVVNLIVGSGTVNKGEFRDVNWSVNNFLKVELQESNGNYKDLGTIKINTVPKALFAHKANSVENQFFLSVNNFGTEGDGSTDDTAAFQAALDSAAVHGNTLIVPSGVYKITETLQIPSGIRIIGESVGKTGLGTPHNGSVIYYYGNYAAISIKGGGTSLSNLSIVDKSDGNASSGLRIMANGIKISDLVIENMIIYGFTEGMAMKLYAKEGGSIIDNVFAELRLRHAKVGVHFLADNNSKIEGNTFRQGAISGGGFDYCLLVESGNDNQFIGTVMEPYSTNINHVKVKSGAMIKCVNVRIEGIKQLSHKPMIYFENGTSGSCMTGLFSGGIIIDKGNNNIFLKGSKNLQPDKPNFNILPNPNFNYAEDGKMPGWDIMGLNYNYEVMESELIPDYNVIRFEVGAGGNVAMGPAIAYQIKTGKARFYDQINFGTYVKSSDPDIVFLTTKGFNAIQSSASHTGDGDWQFIGLTTSIDRSVDRAPCIIIQNPSMKKVVVEITTPTLTFGNKIPELGLKPITAAGGELSGRLTLGFANLDLIPESGYIVLPSLGNNILIKSNTGLVKRINHLTADHVPKGTVIRFLFEYSGVVFENNAYLHLLNNFESGANTSLSLISLGNGEWKELDRNQ